MDHLQARLAEALPERYAVKAELGRGGMSVVFLVYDRKHECDVALKVLRPELSATLGPARFLEEIKTAARLKHPYILKLHDSGQAGGLLYYVMPYVEGESLRDRLVRERQLPLAEALRIAREVAEALDYAHRQNVVHRDIKPENILFEGGHAVVSDFGIALAINKAHSRDTGSGVALGTVEYMSPEQAQGKRELDGRSDVYSLALVLYEMLSGDPPRLELDGPVKTLERLRPDVPPGLSAVLTRALSPDPDGRYATAGEFADALARVGPRHFYERRRVQVMAMPGVALVALGAWWLMGAGAQPLDPNKVVVFPLIHRAQPEVGEEVALMIGSALEHTEPLKWIDGWTWLAAGQRADVATLTRNAARRIARDRGARYYIDGSIVPRADSSTVILRLNDALGDSIVSQESASGSETGTSPARLSLQAVNHILPRLLEPGRQIDLTPLIQRKPAAVASWLQGEREYRSSRFSAALNYYRRAVATDSALAFAALKGAQAAGWMNLFAEAERLIEIALAHQDVMPERHIHLAYGLAAYWEGRADSAIHWLNRALAERPEWAEAQMALSEVFTHLLPSPSASPDSAAEASLLAAAASDSGFSPPLFHLAEIAIRRGDARQAGRLLDRLRQFDSPQVGQLALMLECVRRGTTSWAASPATTFGIVLAAKSLAVGISQPACAEAGFREVLGQQPNPADGWGALLGLQGVMIAQGRHAEVIALLDSTIAAGTQYANILFFIDAMAGAPMRQRAAEAARHLRSLLGDGYERLTDPEIEWMLGVWHAAEGDSVRLKTLREALIARGERTGDRRAELFGRALTAHLTLLRRDTVAALSQFRDLVPSAPRDSLEWQIAEPLAVERIRLAQILLARGEFDEAYRVAAVFDNPAPIMVYLPFTSMSLEIRYEAARKMGRAAQASQNHERLVRIRGEMLRNSAAETGRR